MPRKKHQNQAKPQNPSEKPNRREAGPHSPHQPQTRPARHEEHKEREERK